MSKILVLTGATGKKSRKPSSKIESSLTIREDQQIQCSAGNKGEPLDKHSAWGGMRHINILINQRSFQFLCQFILKKSRSSLS